MTANYLNKDGYFGQIGAVHFNKLDGFTDLILSLTL